MNCIHKCHWGSYHSDMKIQYLVLFYLLDETNQMFIQSSKLDELSHQNILDRWF